MDVVLERVERDLSTWANSGAVAGMSIARMFKANPEASPIILIALSSLYSFVCPGAIDSTVLACFVLFFLILPTSVFGQLFLGNV